MCLTSQCRNNIFRTAAKVWFCLGLAEREVVFVLELLSYCPSEWSAADRGVLGADATGGVENLFCFGHCLHISFSSGGLHADFSFHQTTLQ